MIITGENVVVTFDGIMEVSVTVPEEYNFGGEHKLSGLCGNHDGDPKNDFIDYAGVKHKTAKDFAEVYLDEASGKCVVRKILIFPCITAQCVTREPIISGKK